MISYLISFVFYFILILLIKNTYVSPIKKNSWNYKESDYTEELKLPLWLWFISIVLFLIPYINAFVLGLSILVYLITVNVEKWGKIKPTGKFFKFLNKKF